MTITHFLRDTDFTSAGISVADTYADPVYINKGAMFIGIMLGEVNKAKCGKLPYKMSFYFPLNNSYCEFMIAGYGNAIIIKLDLTNQITKTNCVETRVEFVNANSQYKHPFLFKGAAVTYDLILVDSTNYKTFSDLCCSQRIGDLYL